MSHSRKHILDQHVISSSSSSISFQVKKTRKASNPASNCGDDHHQEDHSSVPRRFSASHANESRPNVVGQPGAPNPRDPFDILDDDIVHIIINNLTAVDSEKLRRVSKLWKASSEGHCGWDFFRLHFPEEAANIDEDDHGSIEEENLRFRRYLHYRESLRRGYATRVIRCTEACRWQLEDHNLVWSNLAGDIFIRSLRTAGVSVCPPDEVADEVVHFRHFPSSSRSHVQRVRQLGNGDLIVQLAEKTDRNWDDDVLTNSILRVSKTGSILWEITNTRWGNPAIGMKEIYFIEEFLSTTPKVIKFSLQDGSMLSDSSSSMREDHSSKKYFETDRESSRLMLTKHEKFAVWENSNDVTRIISISSGEVVFSYMKHNALMWIKHDDRQLITSHAFKNAWPSAHLNQTLSANLDELSAFITWNEDSHEFQLKWVEYIDLRRPQHFDWTLNDPSAVFFRTVYTTLPEMVTQPFDLYRASREKSILFTDSFTHVMIATARLLYYETDVIIETSHYDFEEEPVTITLPVPEGQPNQRRLLEMTVQFIWDPVFGWRGKDGDVLQMMDKYLVFHSGSDQALVVIDFWPSW